VTVVAEQERREDFGDGAAGDAALVGGGVLDLEDGGFAGDDVAGGFVEEDVGAFDNDLEFGDHGEEGADVAGVDCVL